MYESHFTGQTFSKWNFSQKVEVAEFCYALLLTKKS